MSSIIYMCSTDNVYNDERLVRSPILEGIDPDKLDCDISLFTNKSKWILYRMHYNLSRLVKFPISVGKIPSRFVLEIFLGKTIKDRPFNITSMTYNSWSWTRFHSSWGISPDTLILDTKCLYQVNCCHRQSCVSRYKTSSCFNSPISWGIGPLIWLLLRILMDY